MATSSVIVLFLHRTFPSPFPQPIFRPKSTVRWISERPTRDPAGASVRTDRLAKGHVISLVWDDERRVVGLKS